jgi:DNA-binding transcriptional ArsR family regulator
MRDLELALKAAGDPTRTRILKLLEASDLCVCQIQALLALAPSTVSKHLTILKLAGFVEDRRDGKWVYYTLAADKGNPYVAAVLLLLKGRLDRDPRIRADRRRLRQVLALPVDEICNLPPAARSVSSGFRSSPRRRSAVQV